MEKKKEYFELKIESLRVLGKWAADCAERALFIYEEREKSDSRPRDAINGHPGIFHWRKKNKSIAHPCHGCLRCFARDERSGCIVQRHNLQALQLHQLTHIHWWMFSKPSIF